MFPASADQGTDNRSKKDLYVLDLPAAERSSSCVPRQPAARADVTPLVLPGLRAMQANPFIHDVNQQDASLLQGGETGIRGARRPYAGASATLDQEWWSQTGSNRRPEACKATALPTELWPRLNPPRKLIPGPTSIMVGLGRFELPTSRLSSARSNQLSYRPESHPAQVCDLERKRNVDGGVPQMSL